MTNRRLSVRWPRRSRSCAVWLLCCGVSAGAISLSPARALGVEPLAPTISELAAHDITEQGATLEAQIDPEGSETTYALWIQCFAAPAEYPPCEPAAARVYGEGTVGAAVSDQAVSLKVAGLQPGYFYMYWIVAANSHATTESRHRGFATAPYGACRAECPYVSEVSEWFERLSEEESAQTLREYEAKHAVELEALRRQQAERQHELEAAAATQEAELGRRREEEARSRASAGAWLTAESLTVRGGTAIARLECLGTADCRGHLRLTAKHLADSRDGKRNTSVVIGTSSFSIAADEERRIPISLNPAGRRLLRLAHGRVHATLTMIVLAPSQVSRSTVVRLEHIAHP